MAFALGFYMRVRLCREACHVTAESAQPRNRSKCAGPSPALWVGSGHSVQSDKDSGCEAVHIGFFACVSPHNF